MRKKQDLRQKKWGSPYDNKPMNTHDTTVQVCSVSQCAKNQNCTHVKPYWTPDRVCIVDVEFILSR